MRYRIYPSVVIEFDGEEGEYSNADFIEKRILNKTEDIKREYYEFYECDIDNDGIDERVLIFWDRQEEVEKCWIEKQDETGEFKKAYDYYLDRSEQVSKSKYYENESKTTVVEIEGEFYICRADFQKVCLYKYNAEQNRLVMVYEYHLTITQNDIMEA